MRSVSSLRKVDQPVPRRHSRLRTGIVLAPALAGAGLLLWAGWMHPIGIGIVFSLYLAAYHTLRQWTRREEAPAEELSRAELFQIAPCYISVQNASFRIVKTNNLFRRDFGHCIGKHCYQVYKGRTTVCPDCPVEQTFRDGFGYSREETVELQDGSKAQVIVYSSPIVNEKGRISHVMEMMTNITEVKKLQSELELRRGEYKRLFDAVPCYISVHDREFRIVESNALFERHFGDRHGEHCYEVYKSREKVCSNCPVAKSFEDGRSHSSEEILLTRDGQAAHMIVYSMPLRNESGRIDRVMEMMTNITEVKQLQRQLTTTGKAVAGMAHRIKNILMGLEGGIFVVNTGLETDDKETMEQGWAMIKRNVSKVSHIVKDMLYCSKVREPSFQRVSPEEIATEVYTLFQKRASDNAIELRLEIPDTPHFGHFDPDSIHSLMTNLVTNAIDGCKFDFSDNKDRHLITLRCHRNEQGETVIEVSDNGAGIPKEAQEKIFEDFFSTKGSEGTGLGLLVAQKIAEEHGGSISFQSEEGSGTTFRAVFPVQQ